MASRATHLSRLLGLRCPHSAAVVCHLPVNLIYQASVCTIFLSPCAYILAGKLDGVSRPVIVAAVAGATVLLGLMGALESRYFARKHRLPPWSELGDEAQVFE